MKSIIIGICGVALMVTFFYSILGIFPAWSIILPLVIGAFFSYEPTPTKE